MIIHATEIRTYIYVVDEWKEMIDFIKFNLLLFCVDFSRTSVL
jgi:hypothetical protein